MSRIGLNDLSTELAAMICNKFKLERSVHKIDTNTISIPIGLEFNPKLDELIVVKNSIVLNKNEYIIDTESTSITPAEGLVWEASTQYPVEFNFIILKAALPNINATLWRGTYTLTQDAISVPITVQKFNHNTDQLVVIKNGTVVAHDEYTIEENTVKAAGENGVWHATKKSPVVFEYIVFKFATPNNSIAINGYHLVDNSVTIDALSPELKNAMTMVNILAKKVDFLMGAIKSHGNYELTNYISENYNEDTEEIKNTIDESIAAANRAAEMYSKVGEIANARYDAVIAKLNELNLVEDLDRVLAEADARHSRVNSINSNNRSEDN